MLKVLCGSCGKGVKSSDAWAGRSAKCPNCNAPIVFPAIDESPPAPKSPGESGSQGVRAEQSVAAAKLPASGASSSAGTGAPVEAPPARKCACCGQQTPVNVEKCVHCGEFLGLAAEARSAATASRALPAEYEDFEVPATADANLVARLAGLFLVLGPIGGFVYGAVRPHGPMDDNTGVFLVSLVALVILGGPGVYLAIKGALGGPRAQANRARGMVQLLSGLGLIVVGGGLTLLVSWIGMVIGVFAVVFIGMIASGAILAAMGFAAVISGRDLKAEMSEMNVFGGG